MDKTTDTPQGKGNQEPIKAFDSGVVSYSLCSDFYDKTIGIFYRLDFMVRAGGRDGEPCSATDCFTALDFIDGLNTEIRSNLEDFRVKMKQENDEAGGNDVMTIKGEPPPWALSAKDRPEAEERADAIKSHKALIASLESSISKMEAEPEATG